MSEPQTESGRALLDQIEALSDRPGLDRIAERGILAIEAEAVELALANRTLLKAEAVEVIKAETVRDYLASDEAWQELAEALEETETGPWHANEISDILAALRRAT